MSAAKRFRFERRIHPGMIRMSGTLWVLCAARKKTECRLTRVGIAPGDKVYRPLTNSDFRWWRLTEAGVNALEALAGSKTP